MLYIVDEFSNPIKQNSDSIEIIYQERFTGTNAIAVAKI